MTITPRRMTLALFTLIAIINILHLAATWNDWYYIYSWIDTPLHMLGGAFIGAVFLYLFLVRHLIFKSESLVPILINGLGFVALFGVLWEFYEFAVDIWVTEKYTLLDIPAYVHFDTLKDLMNDLLGGGTAIIVTLMRRGQPQKKI